MVRMYYRKSNVSCHMMQGLHQCWRCSFSSYIWLLIEMMLKAFTAFAWLGSPCHQKHIGTKSSFIWRGMGQSQCLTTIADGLTVQNKWSSRTSPWQKQCPPVLQSTNHQFFFPNRKYRPWKQQSEKKYKYLNINVHRSL